MIEYQNIRLQNITPTRITKFLGLNKSELGETELKLGEACECRNFRITEGYELQKMEGYIKAFDGIGSGKVYGRWEGILNGSHVLLYNRGGKLYKYDFTNTPVLVGTLSSNKTTFFFFYNKVYILDGVDYRSYNGTTLSVVTGYRPKVAINAPPSGGGTPFEQVNLINGQKCMTFSPDGTSTSFKLPETGLTSVDYVKANGSTITTGFSSNISTGIVTFSSAPVAGTGTYEIGWNKPSTTNRNYIVKNKYAFIYGGDSDTRVFLYGNPDAKNREYFSGITTTPTAEYFPANNFSDIGNSEYAITDMKRQYDRRIVFTKKDTFYGTIESHYDALGVMITSFPLYPLNSEKGNIAFGQAAVLLNNPVSLCADGIYEWSATNVRDERNVTHISDRVQSDLDEFDLSEAVTIDWEEKGEFWICIPSESKCYIYNYRNDTWYIRTNVKADGFVLVGRELWFDCDGEFYKFDKDARIDKGTDIIDSLYELGFYGFNAEWLRKNIRRVWINIKPETKVYLWLGYQTDNSGLVEIGEIKRNMLDFAHMNFAHMGFSRDFNVKPYRFKLKAKKLAYFKLILKSNLKIERATILGIDIKATTGGEIK